MSILVNVVNQKMYVSSNADGLVAGSQQFVRFKFNLSDEWDGLMVFAQFRQGTSVYNQYLDKDNCVYLPSEIDAGICTMMLYGSHATTIGTTNYLTFKIGKNNLVSDAESTDISESLYTQLVTKINELQSVIDDMSTEGYAYYATYGTTVMISGEVKDNVYTLFRRKDDIEEVVSQFVIADDGTGTGVNGKSAYDIALEHGFVGTEEEWLASLKGEPGAPGADGKDGAQGEKGDKGDPGSDYVLTEDDKEAIAQMAAELIPLYDGSFTKGAV